MLLSKRKKRSILIGALLTGITLMIGLNISSPSDDFYLDPIKYQFYRHNNLSNVSLPRILCLILTSPKSFFTRTKAVNDTWAPRCDHYFFVSEPPRMRAASKYFKMAKQLPIAPIENIIPGYAHLTQKSTLAFLFAYENYIDDFDWFVKADDDTYLFVDHLRTFLSDKNASEPVTYGYNFKIAQKRGYHSGGASYVLSQESLRRFYEAHQDPKSKCRKDGGSEDIEITFCLSTRGVYPGKSLDQHNRELFHPLPFEAHFRGEFPGWLVDLADNPLKTHYDCCSDQTISFHYVSPDEQYMTDFLVYRAGRTSRIN